MQYVRFSIPLLIGSISILLSHSCSTCTRQQTVEEITIDLADIAVDTSYTDMARKVFFALPTPIEVSMMIKNSGIAYQASLLNDPANASRYLTNNKMALNLGTYITDLTYAGLFEQTQTVLLYKNSIQQLADRLGILSALDPTAMQRLESSINNRNEVLEIISDTYASCTATLSENDRHSLTMYILIGGWMEGMYIACSMTDPKAAATEGRMKQLVIDQKLTFDLIWQAMAEMKTIPEIATLISDLSELAQLYSTVNVNQSANTVTPAADGKTSDISSSAENTVNAELFVNIKGQIETLRNNFTKK